MVDPDSEAVFATSGRGRAINNGHHNFRALAFLFSEPAGGTTFFFILAPRIRPPRLPPVRGRYNARTGSSPRLSQMEAKR